MFLFHTQYYPKLRYMDNQQTIPAKNKIGCLHVLLVVIIVLLAAILFSLWWLKRNAYASEFTPVELNNNEQLLLDAKLNAVNPSTGVMSSPTPPEAYTEDSERRKVVFSQEELNAVLAKDPELAKRVKFDLSDQMVSLEFLTPMDPEIPLIGGKTFKFNMGLMLSYTNSKPVVAVRGISLGGIPVPAAWWGNVKNKNLVEEFGTGGGFWEIFARGVAYLEVNEGEFILHLKE
jgi:hypothetical protein